MRPAHDPAFILHNELSAHKLKHTNIEYAEMWGIREVEQYPALGFKMICMS